MTAAAPPPLIVVGEPARSRRQLVALSLMLVAMVALAACGVWMIVAAHQQYPGRPEAWIGTGFGIVFVLIALAALVSGMQGWRAIARDANGAHPALVVDESGWTIDRVDLVPWSAILRITVSQLAPRSRRSTRLAARDAGFTMRRAVQRPLDRTVGTGSGLRDGTRYAEVVLRDGTRRTADLALAVAPERFPAIAEAIAAHAAAHDVDIIVSI